MARTVEGEAPAQSAVTRLSDLIDGQEAECFAVLVKRVRGTTYKGDPFIKCVFRDRRATVEAPLWADHRYHQPSQGWVDGIAYRLRVKAEVSPKYGMQVSLLNIRPAGEQDESDGYSFHDLVDSTRFSVDRLFASVHDCIDKYITEPLLKALVVGILRDEEELFKKMQAASNFHHAYTGGLLEHVWSMTRISGFLADHYAKYYADLDPPLDRGVIVAATVLHDIGKLRELAYHPVEARYTKEGQLIGHVLMGRDMVRDAALKIDGFPPETLLLLEHAILSHHGRREYGAPIVPLTMEALIVSHVDDLDAKVNAAARGRLADGGDGEFTDKIWPLDNRRMYKGLRTPPSGDEPPPGGC